MYELNRHVTQEEKGGSSVYTVLFLAISRHQQSIYIVTALENVLYIVTALENVLYIVTALENVLYIVTALENVLYIITALENVLYIPSISLLHHGV